MNRIYPIPLRINDMAINNSGHNKNPLTSNALNSASILRYNSSQALSIHLGDFSRWDSITTRLQQVELDKTFKSRRHDSMLEDLVKVIDLYPYFLVMNDTYSLYFCNHLCFHISQTHCDYVKCMKRMTLKV